MAPASETELKPLAKLLRSWDLYDDVDQSAPLVFQSVFRHFTEEVFVDEMGEELLAAYRSLKERVAARVPEQFSLIPAADFEIRAVEEFRQRSAAPASYSRPAPDGSRPGIFYVNTCDVESRARYQVESIYAGTYLSNLTLKLSGCDPMSFNIDITHCHYVPDAELGGVQSTIAGGRFVGLSYREKQAIQRFIFSAQRSERRDRLEQAEIAA